jgi:hypothetical protein
MESESERLDRQIVDMRIAGKGEGEISRLLGVTIADVHRAVDAQAYSAAVVRQGWKSSAISRTRDEPIPVSIASRIDVNA